MRAPVASALALSLLASCAPQLFLRPDDALVSGPQTAAAVPPSTAPQAATPPAPSGGLDLGGAYRSQAAASPDARLDLGQQASSPQPPLLGWNGDVVPSAPAGNTVEGEGGGRALDPAPGGRTYIIELYQKALDERDALAKQVDELQHSLDAAQKALDESSTGVRDLQQSRDGLQTANERLTKENADLAARLATAQIRRLEAEKMLLEAQIRWQRSQAAAEPGPDGPTADHKDG